MIRGAVAIMLPALAACVVNDAKEGETPTYDGATATFLTDDLAQVVVKMRAGGSDEALRAYADCALAEALALREAEFARHVRTLTSEEAGIRRADAVYTIETARPDGDFVLDGAETRAACADEGIPGV